MADLLIKAGDEIPLKNGNHIRVAEVRSWAELGEPDDGCVYGVLRYPNGTSVEGYVGTVKCISANRAALN